MQTARRTFANRVWASWHLLIENDNYDKRLWRNTAIRGFEAVSRDVARRTDSLEADFRKGDRQVPRPEHVEEVSGIRRKNWYAGRIIRQPRHSASRRCGAWA